ncbi:hypothetical protein V8E51_019515 [Hyaloscypha variabilis]
MGAGASRQDMVDSKWWEAEAHRMLTTTTSIRDMKRPSYAYYHDVRDLDTLFTLHYKQNGPEQQSGDLSKLTADIKAQELWRALRFPSGYRDPVKIADDFHAAVCRAVFRVPPFDFVKSALGYSEALFIESLLNAARDVRTGLQSAFRDRPETKDTYVKVEKILQRRYHPLAYWVVASSLHNTTGAPYDGLASILDPIKKVFATRDLDLVLKRLAAGDKRRKAMPIPVNATKPFPNQDSTTRCG